MIVGSVIWWAFVALSVLLLAIALPTLLRAYRRHRDTNKRDSEHGLVVATTFASLCVGLILTSSAQALGSAELLAIGGAAIRGPVLVCLLYLYFMRPSRGLRTRATDREYDGTDDH